MLDKHRILDAINLSKTQTSKEIQETERKKEVDKILSLFYRKNRSDYFYCSILESLYFYLDMPSVREFLVGLYRNTKSEAIKETIRALHDGTLDMTKYFEELDAINELDATGRQLDKEYYEELSESEFLNRPGFDPKLLKAVLKKI